MATCKQLSCNESVEKHNESVGKHNCWSVLFKNLLKNTNVLFQNRTIQFSSSTHSHLIIIDLSQTSSLVVRIAFMSRLIQPIHLLLLFSPLLLPGGTVSSVCLLMYSLSFFSRTRPHHFEQYRFAAPLCDVQSLTVWGGYTSSSPSLPVSSCVSQSSALYRT